MRSFEERKKEIYKRSTIKLNKIKKRKKILYTILPCFILIICMPYIIAVSRQKNSEDLAPIEEGVLDIIENDSFVISLSISCDNSVLKTHTDEDLMLKFADILKLTSIDKIDKTEQNAEDYIGEAEEDVNAEFVTPDDSGISKTYDILLEYNNGTVVEYMLKGNTIYNKSDNTVIAQLDEIQLKEFCELLYIK